MPQTNPRLPLLSKATVLLWSSGDTISLLHTAHQLYTSSNCTPSPHWTWEIEINTISILTSRRWQSPGSAPLSSLQGRRPGQGRRGGGRPPPGRGSPRCGPPGHRNTRPAGRTHPQRWSPPGPCSRPAGTWAWCTPRRSSPSRNTDLARTVSSLLSLISPHLPGNTRRSPGGNGWRYSRPCLRTTCPGYPHSRLGQAGTSISSADNQEVGLLPGDKRWPSWSPPARRDSPRTWGGWRSPGRRPDTRHRSRHLGQLRQRPAGHRATSWWRMWEDCLPCLGTGRLYNSLIWPPGWDKFSVSQSVMSIRNLHTKIYIHNRY